MSQVAWFVYVWHTQPSLGNKGCRHYVQFLSSENPSNLEPKHLYELPFLERIIF